MFLYIVLLRGRFSWDSEFDDRDRPDQPDLSCESLGSDKSWVTVT